MPNKISKSGSELFIVDNSDHDWKVQRYLRDWCQISSKVDIATGYFEIGSLLALGDAWQKVDNIRILMGDEVSLRTKRAFEQGLSQTLNTLDNSLEKEKEKNDFLVGVPAIVEGIRSGKITCRVYRKDKFHAKAYITHGRLEVVGASALVGSSNFTCPGLTENIELNVQITGRPVGVLQEWFEEHWNKAEDVTPEILRTIERHTREYTPFEVYARSLQEYFRSHEMSADDWEREQSKMYPILATYQKQGYHGLLKRANKYGGAFLCDGVGLGKTYIGLMAIERLVLHEKKRVVLFVPKAAREAVWESKIKKYLPEILGGFLSFRIYNHTDLLRKDRQIRMELEQMKEQADVVVIDEAHHFRNTGIRGIEGEERRSRYWEMFDICDGKQIFLLTATPVNNRLTDFQHMTELFSRRQADYFSMAPLGIHSFSGHIRKLEKAIEAAARKREKELGDGDPSAIDSPYTNLAEAEQVLRDDTLFEELVVQRSRAYVKKSLVEEDDNVMFPESSPPKVVPYSVKQTYGKLLKMVEEAFHKKKPLFSLAMYYPWEYYTGERDLAKQDIALETGRQKQVVRLIRTSFLKRFESSVFAFKASCETLMKKLIAFYQVHAEEQHDKDRLNMWLRRNKDITGFDPSKQHTLFPDQIDIEMIEDDAIEPEFFQNAYEDKLNPDEFNIAGLLADALNDLETIGDFLRELAKFEPKQDKKLQSLIQLLRGHTPGLKDVALQRHKLLIFTEFKDTARYLAEQLAEAGFEDVVEIDSATPPDGRLDVIRSFAPYYNDSSSAALAQADLPETRILISTDVLSEGLNLQDATRLINYDLHWNPVRLMQRIGRIDRRLDPEVEARIITDHPDVKRARGTIQYYNFLPPEELNELLTLYKTVTHKTLRISKTFGIENGKLLRPDDDYDILRDFIRQCEGTESQTESLSLEFQKLLRDNPELEASISQFPNRVFSGKEALSPDATGVFFCYARPARKIDSDEWTIEAGDVRWYLYDIATEKIIEDPYEIAEHIRSTPNTPRLCRMEQDSLVEIRNKIDKFIKNTYLKKVQAPIGVKPTLRVWMELC
ncbi:MAG TPA: helicase [Gammaproteobacteria bacterium]|nr:helicase [Gammaproteobacteria bacterium]